MILEYIVKTMWKKKKPAKVKILPRKPIKTIKPTKFVKPGKKGLPIKPIPIVQMLPMADGGMFQQIIGATKPGQAKMQFPYELPTIVIGLDKETKNTLLGVAGVFATGMIVSRVLTR